MPAFSNATTDQKNALRSGGWAGDLRVAICPNDIVFQATVDEIITDASFIDFLWTGTLQGAYTDVVVGQTFFITETDDPTELRTPLLRGRVSQNPSASTFYCNESAINLLDTYIVTVITNFEVLQKDRIGDLVDGWQSFEDLAPIVKQMNSFYYVEDAVEGQFSFAPIGQAMAEGATITGYVWTIAGASYDSGSSTTQNITVTVPYGHTWAYLDITDSNSTTFRFIFEILVCLRDDDVFMFQFHDNVSINATPENGWNVSATFFAGVETLLNRTRCAIVVFDYPRVGAVNLFSNVAFVGYIVSETTEITSDPVSSLLSQTSFEFQSFSAIAGQLPVPSLAVRNAALPAQWGEMKYPTPQRTISYLMTRYSTLSNLCAMDMLFTDSTWFAGEMDLEEGTLLDSINRIGEEIQARLVFFPQGDATFEINANFLSDVERDALPTLLLVGNLEQQDLYSYSLPIPYYKTIGQVEAGCATFYTDGSTPIKLDALAPATARQEGNERPVILAQLLEADLSQGDAIDAAKQRIGDLLEYLNPSTTLPSAFTDGWHCLTPSTRVWLTYDLPASDSTRGLPVDPSERYLLTSLSLVWQIESGAWDVQGTGRLETRGGLAQQAATISPNTINTDLPVLPALSDYDAFSPDGSLNYDSTDPLDIDRQPYGPQDMGPYTPMTTEDAANAADNTNEPTCALVSPVVNFSSITSRSLPRPTVIGATYTATVKGSARLSSGAPRIVLVNGAPGVWPATVITFIGYDGDFDVYDITTATWGAAPFVGSNGVSYYYGMNVLGSLSQPMIAYSVSGMIWQQSALTAGGLFQSAQLTGQDVTQIGGFSASAGTIRLKVKASTGIIPPPTGEVLGDAFYRSVAGGAWELYTGGQGLLLNGTPLSVPPEYNESHVYTFAYTGDGNATPFAYYLTDYPYSGVQNLPLYIQVCGRNLGT